MMKRSILMVYTGDGKGKTTAAFGSVYRALGRRWKVGIVQFVKGKWVTGEHMHSKKIEAVDHYLMGEGFTWESKDLEIDKAAAREAWAKALHLIQSGEHKLVVLDEFTYPMTFGWIDEKEVIPHLLARPPHVNVVITGRDASPALIEAADLVSEMRCIKHPFEKGLPALVGIDF